MALAVVSVMLEQRSDRPGWVRLFARWPGLAWGGAIAAWLFLSLGIGLSRDPLKPSGYGTFLAYSGLMALIGLLAVLPAVVGRDGGGYVRQLLHHPTMTWLGLISYGIYLYHLPVLVGVWKLGLTDIVPDKTVVSYTVVAVPATVALAALSWYVVERPALKLKSGRQRVPVPSHAPAEPEREPAPA